MVLCMPSNTPLWLSVLAVGIAIVVIKHIAKRVFGGVGRNMFNPALVGHVVATELSAYGMDHPVAMSWLGSVTDAVASATPLQLLADGDVLPNLGRAVFRDSRWHYGRNLNPGAFVERRPLIAFDSRV